MIWLEKETMKNIRRKEILVRTVKVFVEIVADAGRFFERFFPFVRLGLSIVYSSTETKEMFLLFSRET